jgi:hypothetical protein
MTRRLDGSRQARPARRHRRRTLVTVEEAGVDVAALREEAAAIRTNLDELAGDCALSRMSLAAGGMTANTFS